MYKKFFVGVLAFGTLAACSFTLNTTSVQCLSESECLAKGAAFANTTCDPTTKTCVPVDVNAGLCTTNQDCISQNANAPAYCRKSDKKCILLETPECPYFHGTIAQVADDNVVIIGELNPTNQTAIATQLDAIYAMTQSDFTQAVGGLPPALGSTKSRPVVIVGCNELGAGYDGLLRAANHLVNDLQVQLILGPVNSNDANVVLSQVTLPNKVVSIEPITTISSLSDLPNPVAPTPMVWRVAPSDSTQADMVAKFFDDFLCIPATTGKGCDPTSYPVTSGNMAAGTPMKVMMIESGDLIGLSQGAALAKSVKFNCSYFSPCGLNDNAAPTPPANWTDPWPEYALGNLGDQTDPVNNPVPAASIAKVIAAALAFKPNVILWPASVPSLALTALQPLEQQWGAANPGVPPPIHIEISAWGALAATVAATPFGQGVNLRKRMFFMGAKNPPASTLINDFSARFFAAHPEFTGSTLSALHYEVNDVAYMAFYAMAAVGSAPLTGPNIAQALANGKLNPPGTPIDAEPSQFGKAFGILAQGGSIDINGLFGPEDFNTKTGASNGLAEIQCVNSTFKVASSGYSWDDASKASVGSVSNCN